MTTALAQATGREAVEGALLDAAERLLVDVGHAGITTRRLAQEAGVNHGLVHYYFGSMENVLAQALERFTARLIARQRSLYATDLPFPDKWRAAMRHLTADDAAYQKVWLELQSLAWNNASLLTRLASIDAEWRDVLREAFDQPRHDYRVDMPLEALVSLVMTFNRGVMLERQSGIETGHRELLAWIDGWIDDRG